MESIKLKFGDWIILRRNQLNLSQRDLAAKTEIDTSALSRIENGSAYAKFTPKQTFLLIEVLQTDKDTFIKASEGELIINYG